jgi:hypothetical protein
MKNLLALFEITGNGSQPYREAGWNVVQVDIQAGIDILEWDYRQYAPDYFRGIIAFPPCTAYSLSGARWWAGKDAAGETEYFDSLVRRMLEIVEYFRPGLQFWYAENPVGRIAKRVPEIAKYRLLSFNPCEFGEPYTKKTILFGEFNPLLVRHHVKPTEGSKMHTKFWPGPNRANARSATPKGFSKAFFDANN